MNIILIDKVGVFLNDLTNDDRAKVKSVIKLFEEFGQKLPSKYLKRMIGTKGLWELRAKRIRLFVFIEDDVGIIVHGIMKKTQQTPKQDIELAVKRGEKAKEDLL